MPTIGAAHALAATFLTGAAHRMRRRLRVRRAGEPASVEGQKQIGQEPRLKAATVVSKSSTRAAITLRESAAAAENLREVQSSHMALLGFEQFGRRRLVAADQRIAAEERTRVARQAAVQTIGAEDL